MRYQPTPPTYEARLSSVAFQAFGTVVAVQPSVDALALPARAGRRCAPGQARTARDRRRGSARTGRRGRACASSGSRRSTRPGARPSGPASAGVCASAGAAAPTASRPVAAPSASRRRQRRHAAVPAIFGPIDVSTIVAAEDRHAAPLDLDALHDRQAHAADVSTRRASGRSRRRDAYEVRRGDSSGSRRSPRPAAVRALLPHLVATRAVGVAAVEQREHRVRVTGGLGRSRSVTGVALAVLAREPAGQRRRRRRGRRRPRRRWQAHGAATRPRG